MIGRILDGRYELVEFVGKGGMALVYRAIDKRTGHNVALKILRPEFNQDKEFLSRFEREAVTASRMNHHNIVNLLDVGRDGDLHYLVMEFVRGRTLKDVIRQKGALPAMVAAQIGIRILSALQHAHQNGIIHRDIKPQNVLVHADGHIKVADFGIAQVAGSNTISDKDSVMGSVHYFSPEQAQGKNVTIASDLYSVGVSLYEMLTGVTPFDGETPVAIALQHVSGKARPISELNPQVPPAIERVVERAMEKRPELRYQSATEMAQDLQRALQEPDGTWLGRLPDKERVIIESNTAKQRQLRQRKKKMHTMIAMTVLAATVLFFLGIASARIYDMIVNTARAPYCTDASEKEALRLIDAAGLIPEVFRRSDESIPAGFVISQNPAYSAEMRKGDRIQIVISTGPEVKAVPRFIGMGLEEARMEAEENGFTLIPSGERTLSSQPWDTVLTQSPDPDEMMTGGQIQVTLSGGSVTLPDMTGMLLSDAQELIRRLDLELIEIQKYEVSDASQFNRVATQYFTDENYHQFTPGQQAMQKTNVILVIYVSQADVADPVVTALPEMEGEAQ